MQPNQTNSPSRSRSVSRGRGVSRKRSSQSKDYRYTRVDHHGYKSRSRSRSPRARKSYDKRRSESGSPSSSRKRQQQQQQIDTRDHPQKSRCLGVFGLSIYTTELQLNQIFSKYGPVERVQVVIDAKTGRSRGFCFIYFSSVEDATAAKEQCSGMEIDERRIRVDYSITQRAHTPTPGVYMGRPTRSNRDKEHERSSRHRDREDDYYERGDRSRYKERRSTSRPRYKERRSPSPYYRERKRRYDRSKSRSYSSRERRYR